MKNRAPPRRPSLPEGAGSSSGQRSPRGGAGSLPGTGGRLVTCVRKPRASPPGRRGLNLLRREKGCLNGEAEPPDSGLPKTATRRPCGNNEGEPPPLFWRLQRLQSSWQLLKAYSPRPRPPGGRRVGRADAESLLLRPRTPSARCSAMGTYSVRLPLNSKAHTTNRPTARRHTAATVSRRTSEETFMLFLLTSPSYWMQAFLHDRVPYVIGVFSAGYNPSEVGRPP